MILFVFSFACSGKNQIVEKREWYDADKTQIKKEYTILKSWPQGSVIQGLYREYFRNGKIKLEGNYRTNQKDGKFILYNEQGAKITEQEFSLDRLNGISRDFYPDGKVKLECTYLKDTLNGPMIEYFDNGNISNSLHIKKGIKDGAAKIYYYSGKLKYNLNYKNGKLAGTIASYDSLGTIIHEKYYQNGIDLSGKQNTPGN